MGFFLMVIFDGFMFAALLVAGALRYYCLFCLGVWLKDGMIDG